MAEAEALLRDAGALDGTGYSDEAVAELLGSVDGGGPQDGVSGDAGRGSLSDRFLVPPFSVLDGRQGYWEDGLIFSKSAQPLSVYKQKEAWEARLGRKATWEEFYRAHPDAAKQHGTSVFDPVLAEAVEAAA